MRRNNQRLIVGLLLMLGGITNSFAIYFSSLPIHLLSSNFSLPRDSDEIEDNPFINNNLIKRTPVDSARLKGQVDYKRYIMDRRYQGEHEDNARHWYDNMFLFTGAGVEQIVPMSDNHHFNPITTVQLGAGVQLGKYHSLRAQLFCGMGYQQKYDRVYSRYGGRAEHLFDLSSYFEGYKPARLLGVSTLLGIGGQYARMNNMHNRYGTTAEFHAGLQFHFYTGPQGYLALEPYFGIASDQLDLSLQQNWRRFDTFYGANINYIYYFTNHLSRAARIRQIEMARKGGHPEFVVFDERQDSILKSWQTPWLFEFAFGPNFNQNDELSLMKTMGGSVSISVGKWFSPVIGIRGTLSSNSSTWHDETVSIEEVKYVKHRHMRYTSGGVEAMLNPFGLSKHFSWDAPYGAYFVGGGEFGWLIKDEDGGSLHCRSEAYTVGLHLWTKLSEGVQFFLEPRFKHNVYKIPYSNAQWNHRFSDNSYSLRIGLTAQTVSMTSRKSEIKETDDNHPILTVGLGGGTSYLQPLYTLDAKNSMPYNIHGYATYHFNQTNGARLGLEFLTLTSNDKVDFTDYNMSVPEMGYAPITRSGLWDHNYHLGMASLAYALNFTNMIGGYKPHRLFNVEAFIGPGVAFVFGETGQLDESVSLAMGHEARIDDKMESKAYFALNGGATLSARLSDRLSLALTHQLYWAPELGFPAISQSRPRFIETFNLGVQCNF